MIRTHRTPALLAVTSVLALVSCGSPTWNAPVGAYLDEGQFGNPTMSNMMVQAGKVGQVEHLNNRFSAEIDSVVTFAFDSAHLSPDARAVIARQAAWIRQFPEVTFRVYGHTDLVGSASYNKSLGLRRANAVVAELVRNGVNGARLAALVSYGETQPLIVTQGREQANRRTVTEVSGFVGGRPTLIDGKYAEVIYREYVEGATYMPRIGDTDEGGGGGE
ncbi:Outer membrane lipoprotein Omp16 precursor [Rhodobacteraceae bacterium THAF1]|uniref:OmpA family protein n=1 Tax=Palleronia sp. THAF1 TaxID=2587842 RepID=UPI000F41A807|nr:OmpA family protein [Palleronia sp. THAF1]QFU07406.1 Outer membrane lipoprotein Omp16 precursor [Palleronia sp. THAF1]VDC20682.1 Outer membrane lipoprotein Omp16 precursor [Rhodobacteraceae bacterium THAF1]